VSDHVTLRSAKKRNKKSAKAKERFLSRIRNAPDLGTRGVIRWSRDEAHERAS
jgi:hypothetical protein